MRIQRWDVDAGEPVRDAEGRPVFAGLDEIGELIAEVLPGNGPGGFFEGYTSAEATEAKQARNLFRAAFAPYYATPVYNAFLAWAGYEDAAATIREGWAAKDRDKTGGALTDAMIDEIAIIGDEDECRARIQADADGGVHTHIVAPMAASASDVQRTFAAFAGDRFTLR